MELINATNKPKVVWFVKVFDNGVEFLCESFETRGKAAAYVMRWNKRPDLRWRAELIRKEVR